MFRQHEDIGDPREGCIVSDDAAKPDLSISLIDSKAKRVLDRSLDYFAAAAARPISVMRQEVVNQFYVKTGLISRDQIFIAFPGFSHKRKLIFLFSLSLWGEGWERA